MSFSGNILSGNIANILSNVIYNNRTMTILNLIFMDNQTNYPKGSDVVVFVTLADDMDNLL